MKVTCTGQPSQCSTTPRKEIFVSSKVDDSRNCRLPPQTHQPHAEWQLLASESFRLRRSSGVTCERVSRTGVRLQNNRCSRRTVKIKVVHQVADRRVARRERPQSVTGLHEPQ